MDVNEQIAKAYFEELHSYIVKANHYFKKVREKGSGPADIDLILHHPKGKGRFGKRAICSIKGWHTSTVTFKTLSDTQIFEDKWRIFERDEVKAAEAFFGTKDFQRILILPRVAQKDREKANKYCQQKYGIKLMDFTDVLFELFLYMSQGKNRERTYDIQALQIIRIITLNMLEIQGNDLKISPEFSKFLGFTKQSIGRFKNNRYVISP